MKYKVLLIDDEPSALEGMLLWIDWQELGFEVCGTSSNGREGLQQMKELEPDLVITDVNMPLLNGLEMIAAWQREGQREIKFAILSGYSEFEYAQTAIRYGINHYLLKPVFPEEAAEELREIHQELKQETRSRMMNLIAASEESSTLIKELLNENPVDKTYTALYARLSEGISYWNLCLIQSTPEMYAEVREKAASLLTGKAAMYLIDLEAGSFGIVYGSSPHAVEGDGIHELTLALREAYPGQPLFIAGGDCEESLCNIANCYRTAKEALMHYFYQPENPGLLAYREIREQTFSYHYDPIRLIDALLSPVNTLDIVGYRQAVEAAARGFREKRVAPEVVKKFAIHIMYRIQELTPEAGGEHGENTAKAFKLPEIQHSMMSLSGLMDHLRVFGESCIELLLQEQDKCSHGIVREINQYMQQHYRESLSIQKLAEVFFLHPVYLGQLLMKKNGINFNEQLHNLRIAEASLLLREHKLKLSEIAEQVGYANYGQFLKQFEKKMHMGPNEYRNAKF